MHTKNRSKGLTLIEMMICIMCIVIGVTIIFPRLFMIQYKIRSYSEAIVNINAIRTAESAYNAKFGTYVPAAASPATVPNGKVDFADVQYDQPDKGFGTLDWHPEGKVHFSYQVTVAPKGHSFAVYAKADIDKDGTPQLWTYRSSPHDSHSVNDSPVPEGYEACENGATYYSKGEHGKTQMTHVYDHVGPCDEKSGNAVF